MTHTATRRICLIVVLGLAVAAWLSAAEKEQPEKKDPAKPGAEQKQPLPPAKEAPKPEQKKDIAPTPALPPPAEVKAVPAPPTAPPAASDAAKKRLQGDMLFRKADWDGALAAYLAAETAGERSERVYFNVAWIYHTQKNQPEPARKYYELALKTDPKDLIAMTNLAESLRAAGKMEDSLKWTQEALKVDPTYVDALFNKAVTLEAQGKSGDAFAAYLQVLKLSPYSVDAYNNAGLILYHVGSLERATRYFQRCVKLQADFAPAYFNLGLTLERRRQDDAALENFREAARLDPGSETYVGHLVDVYRRLDQSSDAAEPLLQALVSNPDNVPLLTKLGELYFSMEQYHLASEAFRKAIAIKPSPGLYYGLGLSEKRKRRPAEAYAAFDAAGKLGMKNDQGGLIAEMAECMEYQGKPAGAERLYDAALKERRLAGGFDVSLMNSAALNFMRLGKLKEAETLLSQAIQILPDAAGSYLNMGHLQSLKGDHAKAVQFFEEGLKRDRRDGFSSLWLYYARMRAGQTAKAQLGIVEAGKIKWKRQWEQDLVAYCAGLKSEEELFQAVDDNDKRCEAYFYTAERLAVLGETEKAKQYYEKCRAMMIHDFYEPWLAEWRLAALQPKKN